MCFPNSLKLFPSFEHHFSELIYLDMISKLSNWCTEFLEAFVHPYSDLMHLEKISKWSEILHSICRAGDTDKNQNGLN